MIIFFLVACSKIFFAYLNAKNKNKNIVVLTLENFFENEPSAPMVEEYDIAGRSEGPQGKKNKNVVTPGAKPDPRKLGQYIP